MSALIGSVRGPHHDSPHVAVEVWCNPRAVGFNVFEHGNAAGKTDAAVSLDPIAARNLAALLVRASEEAERMAARRAAEGDSDGAQG